MDTGNGLPKYIYMQVVRLGNPLIWINQRVLKSIVFVNAYICCMVYS